MKSWRRVPPALHSTPACFEPSSGCGSFEGRQRGPLSAFEPTLSLGSRAPVLRNRTRAGSCFGRIQDRRERRSEPAALEEASNQVRRRSMASRSGAIPLVGMVTTKVEVAAAKSAAARPGCYTSQ